MSEKITFTIVPLQIPMRVGFKHASAERKVTESLWVEAARGDLVGLGEGCPRSYVTGEDLAGALEWAQDVESKLANVNSLKDLELFTREYSESIDKNLSAWCALELAIIDLLAKEANLSVEQFLGISSSKTSFQYTAVLSADDEEKFQSNIEKYLKFGFFDFKLKAVANLEDDIRRITAIGSHMSPKVKMLWPPMRLLASAYAYRSPFDFRLRIDGNNAWAGREADIKALLEQSPIKIWAIEEPFAPRDYEKLSQLSIEYGVGIILDESLCTINDIKEASAYSGKWIANLRVSKLGGLIRSLEIVSLLKRKGWEIIVGAQVGETSVLSRAALVVAQAAGANLAAQEGAFGTILLEKDMATPELRFGFAGVLKTNRGGLGFGLEKTQ